jgi:hypothetical protein
LITAYHHPPGTNTVSPDPCMNSKIPSLYLPSDSIILGKICVK